MTSYVDELMVEATIGAQGCPVPIIERMLRSAMVDFYRSTKAWQVVTEVSSVIAGDPEVELELPTGTVINKIYWLKLDGTPLSAISTRSLTTTEGTPTGYASYGGSSTIKLNCKPRNSYILNGVEAEIAVTPLQTLDDLPDYLYDAHRDGILYGALAKLLAMPNTSWTDMTGAMTFASMANSVRNEAVHQVQSNQAPIVRVVRYGGN